MIFGWVDLVGVRLFWLVIICVGLSLFFGLGRNLVFRFVAFFVRVGVWLIVFFRLYISGC